MSSVQCRRAMRSRFQQIASLSILLLVVACDGGGGRPRGTMLSDKEWLDSACAPTTSQMNQFFSGSPWYTWGIYVGGSTRYCSPNPNLTSGWVSTVLDQGWALMPIWVGRQLPCSGFNHRFSYHTSTAYSQGASEAASAYKAVLDLGFVSDTPIAYDMEATSNTITSSCIAAAKSFIQGWDDYLAVEPAQHSGYYGSVCTPSINNFANIQRPPDFIWGAWYQDPPDPSTNNLKCVSSGNWADHQRHKQYRNTHSQTWNGVTLSVDSDNADGPVYNPS